MLSSVVRSQITLDEDGENLEGFWDSRGLHICVKTSKGFLHIYDVLYGSDPKFEFQRPIDKIYGVGEGNGAPNITLKFKLALEVESGILRY
jgi:hypothetical protein